MAGSFPGANGVEQFWDLLCAGREGLTRFTDEQLVTEGLPAELVGDPRYVKAHGVLPDVELFDTTLFGMTPAEAEVVDPQHRLFLQHCYAALEHAGHDPGRFPGLVGVYGGAAVNTYLQNHVLPQVDQSTTSGHFSVMVGNDKDYLATRVAYKLDLKGPAYTIQTACSTSLVAIHLACQGLINGECDMALAGGVTVKLPQVKGYLYEEGAILSADGHVRAFDAEAGGTVLGNGVGVVVLRPLAAALADGDTVYAVIKGTATNNDGSLKVSYAAPGKEGQAAVIAEAQAVAGVRADSVGYVEAHGTGTRLGDPVEVSALTQAFRAGGAEHDGFCGIGSLKSNVGHLDAAAGVAGVIKTALMLHHRTLVPTVNFRTPNPQIDFASSPFRVVTEHTPWQAEDGVPRRAGVSSFGIGGTNAHAVLEEAPEPAPAGPSRERQLVVLSAKTPTALDAMAARLAGHLRDYPELGADDVAFTLAAGRPEHPYRRAVVCRGTADAARLLDAAAEPAGAVRGGAELRFVFDVDPADAEGLAAELAAREPGFKRFHAAARRAGAARSGDRGALFALTYALGRHWMGLGLRPAVVHADGAGRAAARCLSGELGLKQAVAALADGVTDAGRGRGGFEVRSLDAAEGLPAADVVVVRPGSSSGLETVRDAWLGGAAVDWAAHFGGARRHRVPLPAYPFEGRRCWLPEGGRPAAASPAVRLHPLIDANVSSLWEQRYAARRDGTESYLADHVVDGRRTWPGTAYVEMARAAGELASERRVRAVRDVSFERLLAFDGAEREVTVALRPVTDGAVRFEIAADDGVCARGELRLADESGTGAAAPGVPGTPAVDLSAVRSGCPRGVRPEALYEEFARRSLAYGESFRTVRELLCGEREALARLALPQRPGSGAEAFVLHPALLDGALQAAVGLLLDRGAAQGTAFLPFALGSLDIMAPLPEHCWAHVVVTDDGARAVTVRITLTDDDGVPVAVLDELVVRALTEGVAAPEGGVTAPDAGAARPRAADGTARTGPADGAGADRETGLAARAEGFLAGLLATVTKLDPAEIDPDTPLEEFGIDSLMITRLNGELAERFGGGLSRTLLFEYRTLGELAEYFCQDHADRLAELTAAPVADPAPVPAAATGVPRPRIAPAAATVPAAGAGGTPQDEAIAVIGLSGRYPMADDLDAFWHNLVEGRDCVTEIPADRWDHSAFYRPRRDAVGRSYGKWGGFLSDVDKFDPLFFPVMPREAELMDPQERLFLQTAWHTLEDAAYRREDLRDHPVGVFVGVMYGEYQLYGGADALRGGRPVTNSSYASIANRVSYLLDLHGPSMAVDTMCSSSLTAIHLACESLRRGECDLAVAGGVNVSVHPYKYVFLSQGGYLSDDGRCRSFGAGGSGYVPGEGVGAVLLKPLGKALQDGDHVHGVILASALNHGGRTNGYTVPNPRAQEQVVARALARAQVDPADISYVEAHGTGTALGDPIEINSLSRVFGGQQGRGRPVPIGSVKSNIGHLESAAGIAGLTKVLLQFRHRRLVPSLHSRDLNPHIDFPASGFRVQQEAADWPDRGPDGRHRPRRAGLSSFGAGGSNAHLVLQEPPERRPATDRPAARQRTGQALAFVLSARTEERLRAYAGRLAAFLEEEHVDLRDIAHTLCLGREGREERLAVVTDDGGELCALFREFAAGGAPAAVLRGTAATGAARRHADEVSAAAARGDQRELARLWCRGAGVRWAPTGRRTPLPGYPFARERYWISTTDLTPPAPEPAPTRQAGRLLFRGEWTPAGTGTESAEPPRGAWLLLAHDETARTRLTAQRGGDDAPIVLVLPGDGYRCHDRLTFTVDPSDPDAYARLLADCAREGLVPGVVLHAWSLGPDPARHAEPVPGTAVWRQGTGALFPLGRALIAGRLRQPVRVLLLHGGGPDGFSPLAESAAGFARSARLENPRLIVQSVGAERPEDAFAAALAELRVPAAPPAVRHTGDRREVLVHRRSAPAGEAAGTTVRDGGVYLITGGTGGLGLLVAEHFAARARVHLVLVSRSAPGTGAERRMAALRERGGSVQHLRADVTDAAETEALVARVRAEHGRLDGVVHAAGLLRDSYLLRKEDADADAVLAPKIAGALHLDRAVGTEPLDFFVLFSSVAGTFGNVGQTDYATANAFLDAFAEHRERLTAAGRRSGRCLSLAWPHWAEGGMALSEADAEALRERLGLVSLGTGEGLAALDDALAGPGGRLLVAAGDAGTLAGLLAEGVGTDAGPAADTERPADTECPGHVAATDDPRPRAAAVALLRALVGDVIGAEPEDIDPRAPLLNRYGIDSLAVTRLNADLEARFGRLPKTLFFEYETLEELAEHLAEEHPAALAPPPEPRPAPAGA
ncbi:type I polyketide synthase, partial [Streptomyces sp. NRRL F-5650]|uniref:type I polyketide synthase n=1 Tax=Streptomyces sp. NRRL F-5650 TaxID=1463868 RepID=UPI001F3B0908